MNNILIKTFFMPNKYLGRKSEKLVGLSNNLLLFVDVDTFGFLFRRFPDSAVVSEGWSMISYWESFIETSYFYFEYKLKVCK